MKEFHLQIVTPEGVLYDGTAEQLSVRSIDGEVAVMAGHIPYVTALAKGNGRVYVQGKVRSAIYGGGLLQVEKDNVRLLSPDFQFND